MNTYRDEAFDYCLGFTFLMGVVFAYVGIWSLQAGYKTEALLISTLDKSIWIICGLHLFGFLIASFFKERVPSISNWVLSLTEGSAIFILLTVYFDPHYILGFIIPIIFAIILMEMKQSIAFIALVVAASITVFYVQYHGWNFFDKLIFPIFLLLSVSTLLELVLNQLHEHLDWYNGQYQKARKNEQIIRDNEIKLEKLVNNLSDYKKYLTATNISLIQAREEAEEARNVKQNFVQNVSHELRTPLNLIIGFSETMINSPQSYGEVNWTPDLRGDIECIYQNSQHLKSLIDDILDMASLENKKYEVVLSRVNLNALIHEIMLINESAYKNKGLYLEANLLAQDLWVHGDAIRLKQVIFNLLSNALKYTSKGGVKISTTVEDSKAWVFVRDTGKGIAEENHEKVFDAFFQVDKSNDREDYGTGLGLSISKELIELHGGEMSLTSELGKGTTVFFSVPLEREDSLRKTA